MTPKVSESFVYREFSGRETTVMVKCWQVVQADLERHCVHEENVWRYRYGNAKPTCSGFDLERLWRDVSVAGVHPKTEVSDCSGAEEVTSGVNIVAATGATTSFSSGMRSKQNTLD